MDDKQPPFDASRSEHTQEHPDRSSSQDQFGSKQSSNSPSRNSLTSDATPEPSILNEADISVRFDQIKNGLIGTVINNRYRIDSALGKGGMGMVFKATDITQDTDVAVKLMHPELVTEKKAIKRFFREAKAISHLDHPNAITLHDYGMSGELPFLVMEYVSGETLAEVMKSEGPMPIERCSSLLYQVCQAVSRAHHLGIVHRDLKPDNIIVRQLENGEERVTVLDFGLASLSGDGFETQTKLTTTGMAAGTPDYMAPEQISASTIDSRADIYAIGIMLFEMLSGKTPFEGESMMKVLYKKVNTNAPNINKMFFGSIVPKNIETLLKHMLEREPAKRVQSIEAVSNVLEEFIDDTLKKEPGIKTKTSVVFKTKRWIALTDKRKLQRSLVAAFFAAAVVIGISYNSTLSIQRSLAAYAGMLVLKSEQVAGKEIGFLRKLIDLNSEFSSDGLLGAIERYDAFDVSTLLAGGIDPNNKGSNGRFPLMFAVAHNCTACVESLLEHKADVGVTNDESQTSLTIASILNHAGFIFSLYQHGADIDTRDKLEKTPLMHALENNAIGAVHGLIEINASVNASDARGNTPIFYAIRSKNPELVRLLLEKGAVVQVKNSSGLTPLSLANSLGNERIIQKIVSAGAV